MRILLIGGTGFIGPAVVRRLQATGAEITLFHRGPRERLFPELNHIPGDRRELKSHAAAFRRLAPDVVIDFILSSGRQARELMETFKGVAGRVVALSSIDVYRAAGVATGTEPGPLQPLPLTEDSPLRTTLQTYPPAVLEKLKGVFGWLDSEYDKIPVEQAILSEPELPGTVLRLPFVYGPGDPLHRLFPVVKRIDDGRKVILLEEQFAQWRGPRGFVENVGAAIAAAATSGRAAGRIFNVAEQPAFTELQWTRKVAEAAGWTGEIRVVQAEIAPAHLKRPGNWQQHWVADSTRLRQELGFHEPVALEDWLKVAVEWERKNPPAEVDAAQFNYAAEDDCLD
ncbi:MAG: NAD-dependent epimerase/dehydratase family protein [Acidobacteriia bacterium]|nr:NAD-dependent epimerase/dehydratase family protein [Terriglobia bacterium]